MSNKVLGDIFSGYMDDTTKWVPRQEWIYTKNFTVTEELLNFENINLMFDGLDTFADVYLNGERIGQSRNMFVQYTFDIAHKLKVGENIIKVHFKSPVKVSEDLAEKQSQSYVIPPVCPPNEYHGECSVNMIRKMQASYAWDWGPSFPSVGIWKAVYIEAFNCSVIRHVVKDVVEDDKNDVWILNVDVYLAPSKTTIASGKIEFSIKLNNEAVTKVVDVPENSMVVSAVIEVPKGSVHPWWPNGYGAHDLYLLKVRYSAENEREVSIKEVRVGFRTVELVQDPVGNGYSFYFKVNDVPIFMKGSNEIPVDILPERGQDKKKIRTLLETARDTHMNMLRVWGGGVYESDYFYDLADEMGILIWQDFMFACALYPSNNDFLENVLDEVDYQVKRLSGYTSIALFAGNNENEGALRDDWYHVRQNFTLFKNDYVKLYVDTIKNRFEEITHKRRIFVASSPSNGKKTEQEGYVSNNPYDQQYGDVHYYNYVLNPLNANILPIPRFASEYGLQSLPALETWLTATSNYYDLFINSEFVTHRQHHPLGNGEILAMINREFHLPHATDQRYVESVIYFSQLIQALATKVQTEYYRLHRSVIHQDGRGNTMGALYWQLNDVWVAPTWSGVDFTGKWKILQYNAQGFFAPLIITGFINIQNQLQVYVVSDLLVNTFSLTASIKVFNWSDLTPAVERNVSVDMDSGSSKLIMSAGIHDLLGNAKCGSGSTATQNCFFHLSLYKSGAQVAPDNFVIPTNIRNCNLQNPNLKINSVKKINVNGTFSIELTTDNVALFVWLDSGKIPGRFSENGFLQVVKKFTLFFYSQIETSQDELSKELTITSVDHYSQLFNH
ncbi:unnamed protein product [Acanthoscelides obtectus]|nr:unnamed protein product [Acanthoscelides obtectus]CAK1674387.1 Beta-mannosidase [Acanthoscelides obtectus]